MECITCGQTTTNPKFCGRSCAATYNNQQRPKKPKPQCEVCGVVIDKRSTRCIKCCSVKTHIKTLGEAIYTEHHRSSAYALVRYRARAAIRDAGRGGECEWCGYDKHTEVAHRQPISEFPENTLIEVINGQNNLLCLCPNCHWEHDKLGRRS